MNLIAHIMRRDRCSFTQARKLAGLESLIAKNRIERPQSISELEDGLMLYDKWKNGPFTDTDGTDRLETWIWEHVHQLFALAEMAVESEQKAWENEKLADAANSQSPESSEILP